MTRATETKRGELIALRPGQGRAGDEAVASVPVRPERPSSALDDTAVDLSNVVPFMRPRAAADEVPTVALPASEVRQAAGGLSRERLALAAFLAASLALHGALLSFLWREPDPLASVGVQVISLEIVLGTNAPAGLAPTPGEADAQSAAAAATEPQPTEPVREAEQRATEQPQEAPIAQQDAAPEQTSELERQADEPQPADSEAAAKPVQQSEPKPSVAMVESPRPEEATATPRETPPDTLDVTLLPQPEEPPKKPVEEPRPEQRKAEPKVQPKQEQKKAAPKPAPQKAAAPQRIAAPTKDRASERATPSTPSTMANNIGRGRSDRDTNYRGIVAAHLRRYQQYPADARSRGEQGTAAVTFTIGGGGGVTSVSLSRSSGIASIDREVQAMVRRASPFPAPPGGRPQSFTVPVGFRIQ